MIEVLISLTVTIAGGVVVNCIIKWLDRHYGGGEKHRQKGALTWSIREGFDNSDMLISL